LRHDRDQDARPPGNLTRKQVAVLRLLADGKSDAQIAEVRGTTVKAVEDTIHRISMALGVETSLTGNSRVTIARRYLLTMTGRDAQALAPDGPV
jgi:DNA-binding NarL/FixJ family response regulator